MFVQSFNVNPFVNPDSSNNAQPCLCGEQDDQSSDTPSTSQNTQPIPPRFEPVVWLHPKTAKERLKYAAFKHFWTLGLYVTNGVKFGGDFLVYPGDPTRYHSFFIVQCIDYDDEPLTPANLVTLARLGTSVKKTLVLASLDDDGELTLTSLEWSHWN